MAYAPENAAPLAPARVRPMGANLPKLPVSARVMPAAAPNTTVLAKPALALTGGGQRADSPWLRATLLTPSVSLMTAQLIGPNDPRPLHDLMQKPPQSVVMQFSADPHLGMLSDEFAGSAVVFLATATYGNQTTALK